MDTLMFDLKWSDVNDESIIAQTKQLTIDGSIMITVARDSECLLFGYLMQSRIWVPILGGYYLR